jgi:hypothetical protein
MKGKRQYQLAEDVLASFYEAEDRIRAIRNIFSLEEESFPQESKTTDENGTKQSYGASNVIFNRWKSHRRFFARLQALRFRFKAQFDTESMKPFEDIDSILNDLFKAAMGMNVLWKDRGGRNTEMWNKYFDVIWEGHGSPDVIAQKAKDAVSRVENICSPILLREK